jgi:NAD(P)-dependent dehydrogenase (short-subunit alcohol dehydrogenase family)
VKTAIVTGGNKGIGLETTRLLLERGYRVVVVAREVPEGLLGYPPNLVRRSFDLSQVEAIPQLVEEIGPVEVLINNAGVMYSLPYDRYPEQEMRQMMRVNIEAPVALIREVAKAMVAKGEGRIVNNASIAGQIGHPDVWYGITKAGLVNATKSFARILGPKGIIINAVAPGPVETEMLKVIPEERKRAIKASVYSNRFAYPEEIAQTMVWLATESPAYLNGTCIDINNGAFPR